MEKVKQIEIKNRTYSFYNDMINLKNFESNLLKIEKSITKALICTTMVTLQLQKICDWEIFTVKVLCICLLMMQVGILKKKMEISI